MDVLETGMVCKNRNICKDNELSSIFLALVIKFNTVAQSILADLSSPLTGE